MHICIYIYYTKRIMSNRYTVILKLIWHQRRPWIHLHAAFKRQKNIFSRLTCCTEPIHIEHRAFCVAVWVSSWALVSKMSRFTWQTMSKDHFIIVSKDHSPESLFQISRQFINKKNVHSEEARLSSSILSIGGLSHWHSSGPTTHCRKANLEAVVFIFGGELFAN